MTEPTHQGQTWPHVERRNRDTTAAAIKDIHSRLDQGERRMDKMDASIQENTSITSGVKADTTEIVEMFKSWTGAIKTLEQLGKVARPLSYVVMLLGSIWSAITVFKSGGIK